MSRQRAALITRVGELDDAVALANVDAELDERVVSGIAHVPIPVRLVIGYLDGDGALVVLRSLEVQARFFSST